jgi:hypothetical protein
MSTPSRTTATVDGDSFKALTTNFSPGTHPEGTGTPLMGSTVSSLDLHVDINDAVKMPFKTLQALFQLSNIVTRDKIKDIKLVFWQDDSQSDAICTFKFNRWISHFNISSTESSNPTLSLNIQPAVEKNNFYQIEMGN